MTGIVKPTSGFVVAPMTVIASEMLGIATAKTKHVVITPNVTMRFYFLFIVTP